MSKSKKKTNVPPPKEETKVVPERIENNKELFLKGEENSVFNDSIEKREKEISRIIFGLSKRATIRRIKIEIEKAEERLDHFHKNKVHYKNEKIDLEDETIEMLNEILFELDETLEPEIHRKERDLTKQLLIVYYLKENNLFLVNKDVLLEQYSSMNVRTQGLFEQFVSQMLNENQDAVKKGFQRVNNILNNRGLSSRAAVRRVELLLNIKANFEQIEQLKIVKQIDDLIETINKSYPN
jgi:hypothetical protein